MRLTEVTTGSQAPCAIWGVKKPNTGIKLTSFQSTAAKVLDVFRLRQRGCAVLAGRSLCPTVRRRLGADSLMVIAEIPTDYTEESAILEPVELLYMWRNEGLTPLALVEGYTECFLAGKIGILNSRQQEAVQVVNCRCLEAIGKWHEFGHYFRLNSPNRKPLSPTEVSDSGLAFLREHIFKEALASLCAVKEQLELLREELGTLTDEQREATQAITRHCEIAIQCWNRPIVYFRKSGCA